MGDVASLPPLEQVLLHTDVVARLVEHLVRQAEREVLHVPAACPGAPDGQRCYLDVLQHEQFLLQPPVGPALRFVGGVRLEVVPELLLRRIGDDAYGLPLLVLVGRREPRCRARRAPLGHHAVATERVLSPAPHITCPHSYLQSICRLTPGTRRAARQTRLYRRSAVASSGKTGTPPFVGDT